MCYDTFYLLIIAILDDFKKTRNSNVIYFAFRLIIGYVTFALTDLRLVYHTLFQSPFRPVIAVFCQFKRLFAIKE